MNNKTGINIQYSGFRSLDLDVSIVDATEALIKAQREDGHWIFELEGDSTIPSQYVLLVHYLGEIANIELEKKIANYLRRTQLPCGGWPLFFEGAPNISSSVHAYFALKIIGDNENDKHMKNAKYAIHSMGGAERSNVFTRIQLALYGAISWRAVPMMPVEIILLPKWFLFHLSKISYWARTVIVPLLVLNAKRPIARNPRSIHINELFLNTAANAKLLPRQKNQSVFLFSFFKLVDWILRAVDGLFPIYLRNRAILKALSFVDERLNGEDGFGAIYPAMANTVMMYDALGYTEDYMNRAIARRSIEKLLVISRDEAYCQPCLSPVWDTSLAAHALFEASSTRSCAAALLATKWLKPLQILDTRGDWISRRPNLRPGGWSFQYSNPYYPDVDDTAVVAMAISRAHAHIIGTKPYREAIERAKEWIIGMQGRDGGWGAFEPDNTYFYLNNIQFSEHNNTLIDPSTADVSGRCLSMLSQLGEKITSKPIRLALDYLSKEQTPNGSWYGRWGINYIYGTWSVLCGLNEAGINFNDERVKRGAEWLLSIQNKDSGWGESADSYDPKHRSYKPALSTSSQTAWALLGLMAAGKIKDPAVSRGIRYLLTKQRACGLWDEEHFTATGFPCMFYLRYHGYSKFFPLWALARYQNLNI
ncbi:MAG: squalene--hopene cyclase [Burkholderia sp.]|nr:squalene--hopene cyclase [Burkholderia sp.]